MASEFDDLAAIHAELETARRQYQSLTPIAEAHKNHQAAQETLKDIYLQAGGASIEQLKDQIAQ